MPISSGATGRVDVGVDTSIAWSPDGLKREVKPGRNICDSYLKRYLEATQKRKHKSDSTEDDTGHRQDLPLDCENDGAKDENTQRNGGSKSDTSGKPSGEERPKKSRTCSLL